MENEGGGDTSRRQMRRGPERSRKGGKGKKKYRVNEMSLYKNPEIKK